MRRGVPLLYLVPGLNPVGACARPVSRGVQPNGDAYTLVETACGGPNSSGTIPPELVRVQATAGEGVPVRIPMVPACLPDDTEAFVISHLTIGPAFAVRTTPERPTSEPTVSLTALSESTSSRLGYEVDSCAWAESPSGDGALHCDVVPALQSSDESDNAVLSAFGDPPTKPMSIPVDASGCVLDAPDEVKKHAGGCAKVDFVFVFDVRRDSQSEQPDGGLVVPVVLSGIQRVRSPDGSIDEHPLAQITATIPLVVVLPRPENSSGDGEN